MINIQENISLAPHTTFKIGGPAKFFTEAKNEREIMEAYNFAGENNLPVFILGGGSNLLVSDDGFSGLVIKIQNSGLEISQEVEPPPVGGSTSKIKADAGVPLAKIVAESAKAGLSGLEWAVGIPGTIGGGVCGNCGAYGHSISETVIGGKAINSKGEIIDFDKNFCDFRYRNSVFSANKFIIIEVKLKLVKGDAGKIKEEIKKIITERSGKIPPFPSAGSFFKNYVVKKENDLLLEKFPEMVEKIRGGKIAMGYLIDQCGLKGKVVGGAKISEQHANFIVNIGEAKAIDVLELVEICKREVKSKFSIEPEVEKKYLGF